MEDTIFVPNLLVDVYERHDNPKLRMQRACVDIHGLAADGRKFHCVLTHFTVADADFAWDAI